MTDDLTIPAILDRRPVPSMPTLPATISVANAHLPATYEAAKTALAECLDIDECKDWADKAEALASYARQADDDTLEKMAMRIKARAIRRAGELLKQFDGRGRAKTEVGNGISQREAAARAGMSEHQQLQASRVAKVPGEEFEAAVDGEKPATISQLASKGIKPRPAAPGFKQATHLLGSVKRFAEFCIQHEPELVAGGVMPHEVQELRQHVSTIDAWLDRFVVNLKG